MNDAINIFEEIINLSMISKIEQYIEIKREETVLAKQRMIDGGKKKSFEYHLKNKVRRPRAADIAANSFGFSRKTLDCGVKVVNHINQLISQNTKNTLNEAHLLTELINKKSVRAAYNKMCQLPTETNVRDIVAEAYAGQVEIKTPVGYIDVLTADSVIEIKEIRRWKAALGQVIAYQFYYPEHKKILILFGNCNDIDMKLIEEICTANNVEVVFDKFESPHFKQKRIKSTQASLI